jgi:hypothetical protein
MEARRRGRKEIPGKAGEKAKAKEGRRAAGEAKERTIHGRRTRKKRQRNRREG